MHYGTIYQEFSEINEEGVASSPILRQASKGARVTAGRIAGGSCGGNGIFPSGPKSPMTV
jgi:hypothetical protein